MPRDPTPGELDRRMTVIEQELGELRELVDGQEPWSHRKRLHLLEGDDAGAKLVAEALSQLREVRAARSTRIREWGSFAVALVALIIALLAQLHGYHVHIVNGPH